MQSVLGKVLDLKLEDWISPFLVCYSCVTLDELFNRCGLWLSWWSENENTCSPYLTFIAKIKLDKT